MKKIQTLFTLFLLITLSFTTVKSNAMEKKKVEKVNVIMFTMKSTLSTIAQDAGNIPMELMQKAEELGLEITGPQIWQYRNVDGSPTSLFDMDICIPIKEAKGNAGKFIYKELPEITCVSEIHKGAWSDLKNTYSRMMGEMTRNGMIPGNMSREVYLVCDFENPENCLTEIQLLLHK